MFSFTNRILHLIMITLINYQNTKEWKKWVSIVFLLLVRKWCNRGRERTGQTHKQVIHLSTVCFKNNVRELYSRCFHTFDILRCQILLIPRENWRITNKVWLLWRVHINQCFLAITCIGGKLMSRPQASSRQTRQWIERLKNREPQYVRTCFLRYK